MKAQAVQQQNQKPVGRKPAATAPRLHAITPLSSPSLRAQRKVCACGGGCPRCQEKQSFQGKLPVSQPGDALEREADRVADTILRMPDGQQAASAASAPISPSASRGVEAVPQGGAPLDHTTRRFMEPRFGYNFNDVRIHTGPLAAEQAQTYAARAYTLGTNIVFGHGEYAPHTGEGRRLLAHELTHVVQQGESGSGGGGLIQRAVHEGHDHGGRYEIDDATCRLSYHQNWFFTFRTDQNEEERAAYREAARTQIQDVWSGKFPLIPDLPRCPCNSDGVSVEVIVHTHQRDRGDGHGFTVIVTPTEERGFANQPLRRIDLGTEHETPVSTGEPGGQRRIAHEFGHTIGLTDEYHGWASLFNTAGSRDRPSIMHSGDEVRPRHYQHFADLVNLELGGGCTYLPNGLRLPEYENPVGRFTGLPFPFLPRSTESLIGLQFDRRISNEAILGLMYPTAGVMTIYDPSTRSVSAGPTVGLRLNQLAHPLFVDVRTGLLFDLEDPESALDLRLPLSVSVGIRGTGFEAGAGYTVIADVLGSGGWTHLVGVGLSIDLPGPLR